MWLAWSKAVPLDLNLPLMSVLHEHQMALQPLGVGKAACVGDGNQESRAALNLRY